jgi:hypothetical protein
MAIFLCVTDNFPVEKSIQLLSILEAVILKPGAAPFKDGALVAKLFHKWEHRGKLTANVPAISATREH